MFVLPENYILFINQSIYYFITVTFAGLYYPRVLSSSKQLLNLTHVIGTTTQNSNPSRSLQTARKRQGRYLIASFHLVYISTTAERFSGNFSSVIFFRSCHRTYHCGEFLYQTRLGLEQFAPVVV